MNEQRPRRQVEADRGTVGRRRPWTLRRNTAQKRLYGSKSTGWYVVPNGRTTAQRLAMDLIVQTTGPASSFDKLRPIPVERGPEDSPALVCASDPAICGLQRDQAAPVLC
jgi:hypothetical protein